MLIERLLSELIFFRIVTVLNKLRFLELIGHRNTSAYSQNQFSIIKLFTEVRPNNHRNTCHNEFLHGNEATMRHS